MQHLYELDCEHGHLDASFDPFIKWVCISNLDVDTDFRRQGIGKMLLRESITLSQELNANLIYAAIISRECLDAMRAVFGTEHISVVNEGEYETPDTKPAFVTCAMLHYDLRKL
jgi:hypothetical protein